MILLIESLRKWSCLGLGAPKINLMTLLKDSVKNNVVTLVMKRSSEWKAPIENHALETTAECITVSLSLSIYIYIYIREIERILRWGMLG